MVSQKFMGILHQQPHYSKPSTSNDSSTFNNDIQDPLNVIKEEIVEDMVMTTNDSYTIESEAFDPLLIVKEEHKVISEENEGMTVGEGEQDRNDDRHPSSPKIRKSRKSKKSLPLDELSRDNTINTRPASKRVRREKVIFDPSDDSSSRKRKSRNMSYNTKTTPSDSVPKETSNQASQTSKEDTVVQNKAQLDGNLTCEYCGKYMQRLDYLRLHLMKHTGETPHKCPYCKNGYRARWRLTQHLRTHTKNLPYHCPYCNYRGNRSDYLTSHINRVHKKLVEKDKGNAKIKKEEFS